MPAAGGRSVMTRILGTLLAISLLANLYLGMFAASAMSQSSYATFMEGDAAHRIVVIPVIGMIDDSTSQRVRSILRELQTAIDDGTPNAPKALVLRIDSGGGTVGASDRIWHDLVAFRDKNEIPVVASYGSVAASGGYYISAMADHIIAEPTCVTGSIGVMANVMTFDKLLEKVGVTPEVLVASGSPQKDVANNIMRPWNEQDRAKLQLILDSAHERFLHVVEQGRSSHLSAEQIASLANGAVYTAQQAVANKLIDAEGYLEDAITMAATLAKVPSNVKPQVDVYSERQNLVLSLLMGSERGPGVSKNGIDLSSIDAKQVRRMVTELSTPQLEYRFDLLQP